MNSPEQIPLAIDIQGLEKIYRNGTHALKGLDLSVQEGDFFALLGPNGAGKSTTIGIITSLVRKSKGNVKIFGYDLDKDTEQIKSLIGVVPQEFNFNAFETVENILVNQAGYYGISKKAALPNIEKYLQQLGLWDKRKKIARTLSGGMKRRLMIARALVHEPKLLILDEPTAGVDIEIRRSLWDFLSELNGTGRTIILTTHYLEEAETLCRKIAIINHGKIIRNTDMRSLLRELEYETFILDLKAPVLELPTIPDCSVNKIDDLTLEVSIPKNKTLNDLFASLLAANIEVLSLRNKTNRLEELFLRLTRE
jgi:ABC-2 type transport system ATP-binding protein